MADRALQVVDQRTGVITRADDWNKERIDYIRKELCGDAPAAVADAYIHICKRRGLAPEEKQVYLIKRGDKWSIQTGIDGYRAIADRSGAYVGSSEPTFEEGDKHPVKATVTVTKMVSGFPAPFTAAAYWSEYYPGDGNQGIMWRKMPHTMLAKCAEALALRKAFPADLSGIYTNEEMDQADRPTVVETTSRPASRPVLQPGALSEDQAKHIASLAKELGIKTKAEIQAKAGKPVNTLTPNEADFLIGEMESQLRAKTKPDLETVVAETLDLMGGDDEPYGAPSDLFSGSAGDDRYTS